MNSTPGAPHSSSLSFSPFYYGWFIVLLGFLANLTAAGIRSAPSVLIHPFEAEFGWSRTEIASAAILGGWVRVHFGDYQYAFLIGGTLGLIAACLALTIDHRNVEKTELGVPVELAGA